MENDSKKSLVGTKIKAIPKDSLEIGIDTKDTLIQDIFEAATNDILDISAIESFTNVAQNRENVYKLIDIMSQDSTLASILETYAEDSVETNDKGQIVWCESSDENVVKYVNYLLDSMNVDKHIYSWFYSLIKYGDLYLRLFKQSEYDNDRLFDESEKKVINEALEKLNPELDDEFISLNETLKRENAKLDAEKTLNEDVNLVLSDKNDHYVHYIEAMQNPGEMFELTKFGKTMGYVKAPVHIQGTFDTNTVQGAYSQLTQYKVKRKDVEIYRPTDFVHACLEDNSSRIPEEVNIYLNDNDYESNKNQLTYSVKRGQSLLYSTFKTWRELSLLENSVLLNRLTKSSIVRTIQVEVGDMPKENVGPHLNRIKGLIEQKTAINAGNSMNEYTNPGPIENNIYVPTHEGKGGLTVGQIGGDVDIKSLVDLDYFRDKLFASLRVPKQFFGFTEDSAGFSGGESLAIISSRYGKAVKRIQNTMIQALTDVINLMLLDKGLANFINKFQLRITTPLTKEETERREDVSNKVRIVGDVLQTLGDVTNPVIKLKMAKSLISSAITDEEVIGLIQEQIEEMEEEEKETSKDDKKKNKDNEPAIGEEETIGDEKEFNPFDNLEDVETETTETEVEETPNEEAILPTPGEVGSNNEDNFGESFDTSVLYEEQDNYLPSFSSYGVDGTINHRR